MFLNFFILDKYELFCKWKLHNIYIVIEAN